jgi:short-subunit dehydrogenase
MFILFLVAIVLIGIFVVYRARKAYQVNKFGIVLVTGASTGIGRHCVEYLAKNHSYLVLAGVRKENDAAQIRALKIHNLEPIIIDVAIHDSCVMAVNTIKKMTEDLNLPFVGLVNNAGVNRHLPIEFQPLDDAKALFNTNVFGVLDLVQLTLPMLRESKGRIIMLSSVSGFISVPAMSLYSASKWAVEGLSDALRRELAHFGISVSLIQPAFVQTTIAESTATVSQDLVKDPELNSQMRSLYGKFYSLESAAKLKTLLRKAATPMVTSVAIEHALTAQFPKTRYPVSNSNGVPSQVLSWVSWLFNDRLNDWLVENK